MYELGEGKDVKMINREQGLTRKKTRIEEGNSRFNIEDSRELSGNAEPVTLVDDDGETAEPRLYMVIDARQGCKRKKKKENGRK